MNHYQLKEYGDTFSLSYRSHQDLDDLDKALCYIDRFEFKWITTIREALQNQLKEIGKVKTGDKYDNTCRYQVL